MTDSVRSAAALHVMQPLAERLRPKVLSEVIGQQQDVVLPLA